MMARNFCVFFSFYSSYAEDYNTSDTQTALDSHTFLLEWFQLYPEFLSNPFFISGESYAGVYIPTLATQVVRGIDDGVEPILNFKGYLIGNALTDEKFDNENAIFRFAHGMALRPEGVMGLWWECGASCGSTVSIKAMVKNRGSDWGCDGSADDEVAMLWLNDPKVREIIHAKPASFIGPWVLCTDSIYLNHNAGSMIGIHKNLTTRGYRALLYSGDHDMAVPFTGTKSWIESLGYKVVEEWRPWQSKHNQTAGYIQGYEKNLTFLTIKGAGHIVPQSKPQEALDFYSVFLLGKLFEKTNL